MSKGIGECERTGAVRSMGGEEGGEVGAQCGSGVMLKREGKGVCWEIRMRVEEILARARGERFFV